MGNFSTTISIFFIGIAILLLNIFTARNEWLRLGKSCWQHFIRQKSKQPPLNGGQFFNAMVDLDKLLAVETLITSQWIEQHIRPELDRIHKLHRIMEEYVAVIGDYSRTSGTMNPLNSYLLIKRLIAYWDGIREGFGAYNKNTDHPLGGAHQFFTEARHANSVKYPDNGDLMVSAAGLLQLQEIYQLNTTDLVNGHILDNFVVDGAEGKRIVIGAEECFEIGLVAYNLKNFFYTIEWMEEAMRRLGPDTPLELRLNILEHLAYALDRQGLPNRSLALAKSALEMAPSPDHPAALRMHKMVLKFEAAAEEEEKKASRVSPEKRALKEENSVVPATKMPKIEETEEEEIIRLQQWEGYKRLCQGKFVGHHQNDGSSLNNQSSLFGTPSPKLSCYLKRDKAYLKLAPLKVEIVHLGPLIVLFRGVIADSEIDVVKRLAQPQLVRATVLNATGQPEYALYRISKTAWVSEADDPATIGRLNRRIRDMTNLDLETAFDLKVFRYPIGGHYAPHYDWSLSKDKDAFDLDGKKGNRVATCLFYMSQPSRGGLTIFTELGIGVAPSIHDALFWYNLRKDGGGDLRTKHAACPVLSGDKWIFTKLINERGQEWIRPCPVLMKREGGANEGGGGGNNNAWEEEFVGDTRI